MDTVPVCDSGVVRLWVMESVGVNVVVGVRVGGGGIDDVSDWDVVGVCIEGDTVEVDGILIVKVFGSDDVAV